MARDPFAQNVPQSGIPKWVWLVVGGFAFMLIGLGTTMALVLTRKQPPVAAKPVAAPTDGQPTAPVAAVAPTAATPAAAAAAGDDDKGDDKDGKSDKPRRHRSKSKDSGKDSAKDSAKDSKSSTPAAPAKPKKVMEQKDIDKLLGL